MKATQVFQKSLEYFKGDHLAADVFVNKYCLVDNENNFLELTPDDMHKRLTSEFVRIEQNYVNPLSYDDIYEQLKHFRYIVPGGSPMFGIGNNYKITSLSNCFVIGTHEDSYGGILKLDQELVQLQKRRAGVGIDISFIRPKGSLVKNAAKTSAGIVAYMERYSNTTLEVAQNGRRGALMLTIDVTHPDVEDFIDAKKQLNKITGANISVKLTDEFLRAVIDNQEFEQKFYLYTTKELITKKVHAGKLFDKIIQNAWAVAEPGVLFWDRVISESIPDCYEQYSFRTISTNPCGEIPLCAYDSCRLISLNLYNFVENKFLPDAFLNYEKLARSIFIITKLADDIVDLEIEKIDKIIQKIDSDPECEETKRIEKDLWMKIKEKAVQGRRVGIGITGLGDMLASLGIPYGSQQALDFCNNLFRYIKHGVYRSSVQLAKERGAFPIFNFELEKNNAYLLRIKEEDPELYNDIAKHGRRNISLMTIAPTGSVSILTQTTSGIEPVFYIYYNRKRKATQLDNTTDEYVEYKVFHHGFKEYLQTVHKLTEEKIKALNEKELDNLYQMSPYKNSTMKDIDYRYKVCLQGVIQKHIDHSISVTINMPENTDINIVKELFILAWKSGCKGLTVYREGSRSGILVTQEQKLKEVKRPSVLEADVHRFLNKQEKWIALIGKIKQNNTYKLFEIFTGRQDEINIPDYVIQGQIEKIKTEQGSVYNFRYKNKHGEEQIVYNLDKIFNPEFWNYSKFISSMLRNEVDLEKVIMTVSSLKLDEATINTWKNGVLRVLKKYLTRPTTTPCEKCGGTITYMEGCLMCQSCGYSKCT